MLPKLIRMQSSILAVLALLLLGGFTPLIAQVDITGSITDGASGEPLIGATVIQKGTTNGTNAGVDGSFTLTVESLPTEVIFSFVGYEAQIKEITNTQPLAIVLVEDAELVGEVVVVGYGRQKKRVSTGSIAKVTAEDIEGIPVPDVISTLEGQTSGLLVNESSGQPGAGKSILVRGISTNGDNSPLFIVDGLQLGNIDNINPADIESIDVLKDAASSAIYGARAANGVVIITTKNGSGKEEGTISYQTSYLNSQPWKLPEMLGAEDYVMLIREKFANSNQTSALDVLGFPNMGDELTANTNWMDEIFNPATVVNHRLTATTKNSYLSVDYWDQTGERNPTTPVTRCATTALRSTRTLSPSVKISTSTVLTTTTLERTVRSAECSPMPLPTILSRPFTTMLANTVSHSPHGYKRNTSIHSADCG